VKKQAVTAAFISAFLIVALAIPLFVNCAAANFMGTVIPANPYFIVLSPVSNKVYNTTSIPLGFRVYHDSVEPFQSWFRLVSVEYLLDGVLQEQLTGDDLPKGYLFNLTGLSEGKHTVNVEAAYIDYYDYLEKTISSGTIYFNVDTVAPTISFLQAEEAYGSADAPVNFTLSEAISWIGYSLDGEEVVSVTDTAVLTRRFGRDEYYIVLNGLAAGAHSLTVHAKDAVGNIGASEPFHFTIATEAQLEAEQPASQPFPTTLKVAAAASAVAAIVCIGLVVYFKKRRAP